MKLLSRTEVKTAVSAEEERLRSSAKEAHTEVRREEMKLFKLRDGYVKEREKLEKDFQGDKKQLQDVLRDLENEVAVLRQKRDELSRDGDTQRLLERENAVRVREESVSGREYFYASWKDELEKAESRVQEKEREVFLQEGEQRNRSVFLASWERNLHELSQDTTARVSSAVQREVSLSLREQELRSRVEEFDSRMVSEASAMRIAEKGLKDERSKVEEERRAVHDGYDALQKAREEILGRKV